MRSLALAGFRSVQRVRLISTSCFSRRSSSLMPRTHRSIRSLMMMRSIAVFMQVASSVDINDIPGDEVTFDEKGNGVGDILRVTVTLQRHRVSEFLNVA